MTLHEMAFAITLLIILSVVSYPTFDKANEVNRTTTYNIYKEVNERARIKSITNVGTYTVVVVKDNILIKDTTKNEDGITCKDRITYEDCNIIDSEKINSTILSKIDGIDIIRTYKNGKEIEEEVP